MHAKIAIMLTWAISVTCMLGAGTCHVGICNMHVETQHLFLMWMLRHHVCSSYCLCIKEKKSRRQDGTVASDVKCRFFDIWKCTMVRVEGKLGYYVTADHRPPTLCGKLRRDHKGVLVYDQKRNHPGILPGLTMIRMSR